MLELLLYTFCPLKVGLGPLADLGLFFQQGPCRIIILSICCRLKDVICADQFEYLQLDSRFADVFPDSITIAQTVAVWKHIVHYQERLKQD